MADKSISYAYKLLGIRDYFKNELYEKVKSKFGELEAEKVLEYMVANGYIDDKKTAYNYARSKLSAGYGPYYISSKLYLKGVDIDISFIEEICIKENISMEEHILKYSKRYIKKNSDDPYKDYIKCINFIKNKGYSPALVMQIIKKEDFII